jgi:hypothetical protein
MLEKGASIYATTLLSHLHERVVASVAGDRCCRAVAALFDGSVASVVKWSQRARATGGGGQANGRRAGSLCLLANGTGCCCV